MALKATIFKATLNIADMDRHYYGDHHLTIARHPSETDERMMIRLLAFILNASENLEFTKGISTDDEPDLWLKAPDGRILSWIELGEPSLKRIKQGLSRAERVLVYPYAPRSATQWWKKLESDIRAQPRIEVWNLPAEPLAALTALVDRNLSLGEARQQSGSWVHSRVPLYDEERENIVGMVLRRDAFNALADGHDQVKLSEVARPVHSVPESARASQLLEQFIQRREHLFSVVDEYGGFAGIVTLEDVIEEIVGQEIVGEFDPVVDMQEQARHERQDLTDQGAE